MTVTVRQAIVNAVRVGVRAGVALLVTWAASRFGWDVPGLFEAFVETIGVPVSFETAVGAVLAITTAGVSGLLLMAERKWPRLTRLFSLGFRTTPPSYPQLPNPKGEHVRP